jgi:hypothetical protein
LKLAAFSSASRSRRCRFSTIAISDICRSSTSSTRTGTLRPAQPPGGREPPLPGDELVAVAARPDHDRLHEAVLAEAVGELRQFGVVDDRSAAATDWGR